MHPAPPTPLYYETNPHQEYQPVPLVQPSPDTQYAQPPPETVYTPAFIPEPDQPPLVGVPPDYALPQTIPMDGAMDSDSSTSEDDSTPEDGALPYVLFLFGFCTLVPWVLLFFKYRQSRVRQYRLLAGASFGALLLTWFVFLSVVITAIILGCNL